MNYKRTAGLCIVYFHFFVAIGVSLFGCAPVHFTEEGEATSASVEKEKLTARVNQLMQAQMNDDWDIVYDLADSNFRKEVTKKKFIMQPREVETSKYSIEGIEISPDGRTAKVRIKSDFSAKGYSFSNTIAHHRWILEDGKWYSKIETFKDIFKNQKN